MWSTKLIMSRSRIFSGSNHVEAARTRGATSNRIRWRRWRRVGALGLSLTLGATTACARLPKGSTQSVAPATSSTLTNPSRAAVLLPGGQSIADVAARVTPSVVNVFTERAARQRPGPELSPFFSDPFFRFFFDQPGRGLREPSNRREQSLGSGVIVGADGVIVTNNHVVSQADKIRVGLKDGRELEAKLVGADPKSDVAVLRVDAKDLPAIPVADSSKIRIGDLVLAIGNPFGLGQTVTMGIISAVGRANMGITDYEDFIQTDAAINPGNSGGALVTMDGQLVGINTAIVSRSGGYQGVGFAIPSQMAMQVKDAILRDGKVVRGWLGVAIQDVNEELARTLNVTPRLGVLISDVTPDGPAAKAGIKRGDIVTAIDGVKTNETAHLRNLVSLAGKGKKVRVELRRDGTDKSVEVTLGELPADGLGAPNASTPETEETGLFAGVSVQELDSVARSRMRIAPAIRGVLVSQVEPDSRAASLGLRAGDVIMEINRTETPNVDAFRKAAKATERRALVLVYRDGVTLFMSLSR
jgi:serine protease Do